MRNSSSLDWLRFMHTPNDYRVSPYHCHLADSIRNSRDKKKAIYPRQPIFVNLKSNTMKNTVQRYGLFGYLQIFRAKQPNL